MDQFFLGESELPRREMCAPVTDLGSTELCGTGLGDTSLSQAHAQLRARLLKPERLEGMFVRSAIQTEHGVDTVRLRFRERGRGMNTDCRFGRRRTRECSLVRLLFSEIGWHSNLRAPPQTEGLERCTVMREGTSSLKIRTSDQSCSVCDADGEAEVLHPADDDVPIRPVLWRESYPLVRPSSVTTTLFASRISFVWRLRPPEARILSPARSARQSLLRELSSVPAASRASSVDTTQRN